jgi:hypothetical protein
VALPVDYLLGSWRVKLWTPWEAASWVPLLLGPLEAMSAAKAAKLREEPLRQPSAGANEIIAKGEAREMRI